MSDSTQIAKQDSPALAEDEEAISKKLKSRLLDEIESSHGCIPFDRFMQIALYEPGLGYYSSGCIKFGVDGDFVTAPEISSLFSKTLARQCEEIINALDTASILELGAGTGVMAKDILLALETSDSLPESYYILEPSPALRQRQKETIIQYARHLLARVSWLETEPEGEFNGVILANEVADALPFKRLVFDQGCFVECMVTSEGRDITWQKGTDRYQSEYLRASPAELSLADGYITEEHSFIPGWLETVSNWLHAGVLLISDYGGNHHDYYQSDKNTGSMRCYYRHRLQADPFVNIGLQDITCDINFSELAFFAERSGLKLLAYTTQSNFLLGCGIEDVFTQSQMDNNPEEDQSDYFSMIRELKTLTMPDEMGEKFKFAAFGKEFNHPLKGFSFKDLSDRL